MPKLPKQFDPERSIHKGPFAFWVKRVLNSTNITEEDLIPSQKDLELISRLAYERDEVGDRLANLILKDRKLAKMLEQGLENGSASLENPPSELIEFLAHYENIPEWAYLGDLKKFTAQSKGNNLSIAKKVAPRFFLDGFAMAVGFFIGANYPGVGQSISCTGSVSRGSSRMAQTMQYVDDMMNVKEFEIHGKAWKSNARVRLAHAFARIQIERNSRWDKEYYGEIISEFDNLIFLSGLTYLFEFASTFGIGKRGAEALDVQINAMQYLLGAPKELVTMSMEDNLRLFVMVIAHLDDSPHTARQVVKAFHENEYFRPENTYDEKVKREMSFIVANLFTRVMWGNVMADEIGLDDTYKGIPLKPLANIMAKPPMGVNTLALIVIKAAVNIVGGVTKVTMVRKLKSAITHKDMTSDYSGSFEK